MVLDRSLDKGPVRDCGSPETPFVRSSIEAQSPSMKISPQEQLRRMKLIREDLEVSFYWNLAFDIFILRLQEH